MTEQSDWHGEERRGIQVHILNWVEERLGAHVKQVEKIFHDHTKDEMQRYQEILDLITANAERSERRHDALVQSLQAYTDGMNVKCQDVTSAFLKGPDGKPDFEGHNRAHMSWLQRAMWKQKLTDSAITKLVEWASVGVVIWVGHSVWEAFLKGPK